MLSDIRSVLRPFEVLLAAFVLILVPCLGEESKDEKPKWDVSNSPGPGHDVEIDVTEGTWMSLDVSSDGTQIVFDLLGDIYLLPIEGGEAKALTSGAAWDMQPRFSPNGRWIAFTSDRAGGDNIWVMDRDGSNPRQVTKESIRLLNSPVWTPDSQFIAARKHFTSRRSLGAGEIWLYHRAGSDGVQMVKRPNDQKDLGEPAFSPDGRYLYFSQDTTPGEVFEYDKDSNAGIYSIVRLDRESGRSIRLTGGPGGAIRPTPSPDGKTLAFVRRVRLKTVLFLRDLVTGDEWPVYDALERDLQETWAIHGVYPAMAWTPDSGSVVLWAGGRIKKVDVGNGMVEEVPFHLKTSRNVKEALRHPVEVFRETFSPKMLRWVQVAPGGRSVVFQALGHLYVRSLPDGTARRLTWQDDHFEFYPSFSRDGKWVVYTTWNDSKLGTVRIVPASGGEGRVLVGIPGHYIEPAISPDGQTVVYRRIGGGGLRSSMYSMDQGIYRVSIYGGEPKLISESGSTPRFGSESDRIFIQKSEGSGTDSKQVLASIRLDGTELRTHVKTDNGVEFIVSPDGKWVAWQEGFNAFVAPFVQTGQAVELGPKAKTLPVSQLTREAGDYLHWSSESGSLYWSLGPTLFKRSLTDCFAFLDGAPEKLPEPPVEGTNLSFEVHSDVPSGKIALVGGRVVTMRGDEVIEEGVVLVERNRITAVGSRSEVTVPADAKVIDVKGQTVMPGLIDVHWHGSMGGDGIAPQESWVNDASLAFGVTTIHDPSNSTSEIFSAAEMAKAGVTTAPRVFSTGTILYGAAGSYKAEVDSLEDALFHLKRMKAVGAITVKSYNQPRRDQRQQVVEAARQTGMMVVLEGGALIQHNMTMVVDGHTGIEHTVPVARIYDDLLQLWQTTGVGYTPTLGVAYGGLGGENYWYAHTDVWANERLLTFVPRERIDARARRPVKAPEEEYNHISEARIARELNSRGVLVNLGAHGQREGLAAHWELWMFEQGGMTPLEALRSGTLNGARYLGLDKEIGSLEVGKLADLIVIDGNPLENLRVSEKVSYTMVNGRIYDAATMNQVGNHPKKRGPFPWELGKAWQQGHPEASGRRVDE